MSFKPLAVLLGLALSAGLVIADTLELRPDHPERYVVKKGDTLWDISSRFLRDPWRWPNIWNKNEQVANPHLIYPGDVIVLRYVDGQPELGLLREDKLSPAAPDAPPGTSAGVIPPEDARPELAGTTRMRPGVRAESLESAIPTIKPDAIGPFLTHPIVVGANELKKAGYVTIGLDNRVALGTLSQFYARGLGAAPADRYFVVRPGKALREPDTKEILGYEALYLGEAQLLEAGDPAKLEVTSSRQEIVGRDRLMVAPERAPLPYYYPHAPQRKVKGRILTALNSVEEFGPGTVVSVSLGKREGMEEGHVLRIMRHAGAHRDPVTRRYYNLPDEESGLLLIFRTFEKVSYGLIMNSTRPVHMYDVVQTP